MEIRKVGYEEFDELLDVMDASFGFTEPERKFRHILPKLYYKDNPDMIHTGAYEKGKLIGSVGLYLMDMVNGDKRLKLGCVGAVCTLQDHRGNGVFTKLMEATIDCANELGLDLLFLGGNRVRYGRFGFECAGRYVGGRISERTKCLWQPAEFEVKPLLREDSETICKLLDIYNRQTMRVERKKELFYDTLLSWTAEPYYVTQNGHPVGYFAAKDGGTTEVVYDCRLDVMLQAMLSVRPDGLHVGLPVSKYEELLGLCDGFEVGNVEMFRIMNEGRVVDFLGGDASVLEAVKDLPEREKVRKILGDCGFPSLCGTDMYINSANAG